MPFGKFQGNVNHDCWRYGLYLDNQYPRNVVRDENGHVKSGCQAFTADGKDNGVSQAAVIEDEFDWHNMFVGQYSAGDIMYLRYVSVNNGHSMYWKTSKNFADPSAHHMKDCIIANDRMDSYGRLQVYGPSGPFTFKFTNITFVGGPVGDAALCAGQHCGLGGAGGPCNVQYLLDGVDWSRLLAWQKKIKFGVNSASFGFVQPIFLSKETMWFCAQLRNRPLVLSFRSGAGLKHPLCHSAQFAPSSTSIGPSWPMLARRCTKSAKRRSDFGRGLPKSDQVRPTLVKLRATSAKSGTILAKLAQFVSHYGLSLAQLCSTFASLGPDMGRPGRILAKFGKRGPDFENWGSLCRSLTGFGRILPSWASVCSKLADCGQGRPNFGQLVANYGVADLWPDLAHISEILGQL